MIRTENLTMQYGAVTAVNNISFKVERGEIIGLLGPNGAGKSTTLKIITTFLYPTRGTAYVADKDVRENSLAVRKMIGYLPEVLPLYMDMEVHEYLRFVGNARGLYGRRLAERMNWVKEKCGLNPVYYKMIRELSKGYRQRTALAQALIHDPEIVILDEPTSGLDPHQIQEIRGIVRELAQNGKTVIFSTHILQEVEAITNRIIIINRGKIVADSGIAELKKNTMKYMRCELVLPASIASQEVEEQLRKLPEVAETKTHTTDNDETTYLVTGKTGQQLRTPLQQLSQEKGWNLLELKTKPYSLEEVFLKLTEPETLATEKGVKA